MIKQNKFQLVSPYKPTGDQPKAIDKLVQGLKDNKKFHKGGNKNRRNGLSESRMNTYFSHRHK